MKFLFISLQWGNSLISFRWRSTAEWASCSESEWSNTVIFVTHTPKRQYFPAWSPKYEYLVTGIIGPQVHSPLDRNILWPWRTVTKCRELPWQNNPYYFIKSCFKIVGLEFYGNLITKLWQSNVSDAKIPCWIKNCTIHYTHFFHD